MIVLISGPTTIKNNNVVANNIKSTSLVLKPSANLSLLFNPFNYFSTEQENESKNAASSDYYDIDQFQTLKLHGKNISLFLIHINACSLSKNFNDLEQILKCTNKVI